MGSGSHENTPATVSVRNLGGIDEASVSLPPGVSILTGENATNRTSFLRALMAALGSDRCSLKGDAKTGSVTLELGTEQYTRTLTRRDDTISFDGEPYLDDPTQADLFAFLLEDNEARQAVVRGDGLRELIMRPVDTAQIDADIAACKRDREQVTDEIERLESLERELPALERSREETREEYDEATAALKQARDELEALDADLEQSRSKKDALETAFQRVRDAQATLEDIEFDIETEQATLEELEAERETLEATRADIEVPDASPDTLATRLESLRDRKRECSERLTELRSIIGFNEDLADGTAPELPADTTTEAVTGGLRSESSVTCWTCGSTVEPTQITEMLDRLRTLHADMLETRRTIQGEIDEVTQTQSAIETATKERERTTSRIEAVEDEIAATETRLQELTDQLAAQRAVVDEREQAAESIDVGDHEAVIEQHKSVTQLELRVEQLESACADLDETITAHEDELEAKPRLEAERDDLTAQLESLRTRVEQLESAAIDAFNEHMETVLELLAYDNLDRIWIERRAVTTRTGRRTTDTAQFALHVVRSGDDGAAYEDTIEHLSESEREVTGLVFALAGYLVHEVSDDLPFVVLDSLEAIDADRIARLIAYLESHTTHLVAALLPEDAAALEDSYTYITALSASEPTR